MKDVVLMTDAWAVTWKEGEGGGRGVRGMFGAEVLGVYGCEYGAKTDFGCGSCEGRDLRVRMLGGGGLVPEEGGGSGLERPGSHAVGRRVLDA